MDYRQKLYIPFRYVDDDSEMDKCYLPHVFTSYNRASQFVRRMNFQVVHTLSSSPRYKYYFEVVLPNE